MRNEGSILNRLTESSLDEQASSGEVKGWANEVKPFVQAMKNWREIPTVRVK